MSRELPSSNAAHTTPACAATVHRPAHVLAVDDDALIRDILGRVLGNAGMSVQSYASGGEFLACADLAAPAVLLLDVKMPVMSGLQLQAVLRERGSRVPVVFLTGASSVAMAVAAMRDGAVDFIEKPFDGPDLVSRVQHAYTHHVARFAAQEIPAAPAHGERLASLTPRERQVLDMMVTGRTSKTIARELGGSFRTIEIHRGRVMTKMDVANLADLVRLTIATDGTRPLSQ